MRGVVLATGLVWLAMLAFPLSYALSGAAPGGELGAALPALTLMVGAHVWAVVRAARDGAPRWAPLPLALVGAVAVALPLLAGAAWFGGTVLWAALLGLSLPALPALAAVAGVTGLATAQALLIDVAVAQAISVPLVTAVAGVVVVAVVRQVTLTEQLAASRREIRSNSTHSSPRLSWPARAPASDPTSTWTPPPVRSPRCSASSAR